MVLAVVGACTAAGVVGKCRGNAACDPSSSVVWVCKKVPLRATPAHYRPLCH